MLVKAMMFWEEWLPSPETRERIFPRLTDEERSTLKLLRLKYGEEVIPIHPQEAKPTPAFTKSDLALLRMFRPDKNYGEEGEDD